MERYYDVVHDPYGRLRPGARLSSRRIGEILCREAHRYNGLDFTDGVHTYRLYRGAFYRLEAEGQMRVWRLPGLAVQQ